MNILSYLAQATYQVTPYQSESVIDATAAAAVFATMMLFVFFAAAIGYVISGIFLMLIFKKAGAPAWAAWVPVYNNWKLLEIGGQQGFWAVLSLVPIVNIVSVVMLYIAQYHVGIKLGKSGAFVVLAIFLPVVWLIWLAVDKSVWDDSASPSPSLNKPVAPLPAPTEAIAQQTPVAHPSPVSGYGDDQQSQTPTQNQ